MQYGHYYVIINGYIKKEIDLLFYIIKTRAASYAGDFSNLFEKCKVHTNFCDMCEKLFRRTAFYKHIKSNIHLSTLYKKQLKTQIIFLRKNVVAPPNKKDDALRLILKNL